MGDVTDWLVLGTIAVESDRNVNETSKKGEIGLMQLYPPTLRDLRIPESAWPTLWDPARNIAMGVRIYRDDVIPRIKFWYAVPDEMSLGAAAYVWFAIGSGAFQHLFPRGTSLTVSGLMLGLRNASGEHAEAAHRAAVRLARLLRKGPQQERRAAYGRRREAARRG
jgi:membrane-bound lytic murein transglycosylase MltF